MPGVHDGAAAPPADPEQDRPGAHGDAEDDWERVDHLEESGAADKDFVVITRDRKGSPTWEVELKASHRSYAEAVCAGPFGVKMRKLGPASGVPRAACQRVASRVDPDGDERRGESELPRWGVRCSGDEPATLPPIHVTLCPPAHHPATPSPGRTWRLRAPERPHDV